MNKALTSEDTGDIMARPTEETQENRTELRIPGKFENVEQRLAYQEFINVLSAILVKYAASMDKESDS